MLDTIISKEQFLVEHNKLSPVNLQATLGLLTQFQEEKRPLLKDADWSFKLRIPFISWLLMLPALHPRERVFTIKPKTQIYKSYPETHNLRKNIYLKNIEELN